MNNKCYLIDNMKYMAECKDNQYDLAIVDVNYGIQQDGRNNHTRGKLAIPKDYRKNSRYDDKPPEQKYFDELIRISKNQIIFGANHFISKIPFDSSCWIVWDKDNGKSDFADCELAYTSFKTAVRKFKYRWAGMLQENMKNKDIIQQPNQKPVALYKWLLINYAKPGYKLLDTHSGSGSFRIAAYDMGFDLDSCELDKDYFDSNEKRYKKHIQQQNLFDIKETQKSIYKTGGLFE